MAIAINSPSNTTDLAISTSKPSRLLGWTAVESAGTPALATAVIRDGADVNGAPIAYIGLLASGGGSQWFGPQGIVCPNGIFLDRVTGTTTITVFVE